MGDMEEIIQCPAPAKIPPPTYYQLMQRFAPVHHHNIEKEGAAAPAKKKAMMVVATKKKKCIGGDFPNEVWAKIIERIPHVSYLIPLSMINKTLYAAIWHNHALMFAVYDQYFHWNEHAPRCIKGAMHIPRNIPVYMPADEWKIQGVPRPQIRFFNQHVAQLCRAKFLPWCSHCRAPLPPDAQGVTVIFPWGRLCYLCKVDEVFISDYELWLKYGISMNASSAPFTSTKKFIPPIIVVNKENDDDDDDDDDILGQSSKMMAKNMAKTKKKRPPPKLKLRKTGRNSKAITLQNSFFTQDANGDYTYDAPPRQGTILEWIIQEHPHVFFFTHRGTRYARCNITSNPINLAGPLMNQALNMIFFRKSDLNQIFDLNKVKALKQLRERAIVIIRAVVLRTMAQKEIAWALPWETMTPVQHRTIWERIIVKKHQRACNPMLIVYPQEWDHLNATQFQFAQAHELRG